MVLGQGLFLLPLVVSSITLVQHAGSRLDYLLQMVVVPLISCVNLGQLINISVASVFLSMKWG